MPIQNYQRPIDTSAALEALRQQGAVSLAFGPRVPDEPFAGIETAVDLSALNLNYIREEGSALHLGAGTPLQDLAASPLLQAHAGGVLAEAAQLAAGLGLRNLATLGGALAFIAGPQELRLALLALNATVILRGDKTTEIPVADFRAAGQRVMREAKFYRARGSGALARVARTPRDEAIVAAVAVITQENVSVAVSGASASPLLKSAPLTTYQLQPFVDALVATSNPIGDYRGSTEYRSAMAGVLARRALEQAWRQNH
jgi:CO/xanthine dehydrogenase FAD-binding subunit